MLGIIAAIIIASITLLLPGELLAFSLLRRTELLNYEIFAIGIIFGLIFPATMTWAESYLMTYIHAFAFSLMLFEANSAVLTIIGLALAYKDGSLKSFKIFCANLISTVSNPEKVIKRDIESVRSRLSAYPRGAEIIREHDAEESSLRSKQAEELANANLKPEERETVKASHRDALISLSRAHAREESTLTLEIEGNKSQATHKPHWAVWVILTAIMLFTLFNRLQSIVVAPSFFEFDPYFDMVDAHYILAYGGQLLNDPSAWPVVAGGTNHRIEPIVPYLEAYWYDLVNSLKFHYSSFSTNLMSYIGSLYPPITAALLVFIIFLLLFHEYDAKIGLIGAGFTAAMPTLIATFISGEQLVESWGIMTLFFFFAAYMIAIRNMKDKRLAVLAGIAFVSTFLGAHYYTVTTGVLALYIIIQGSIELIKGSDLTDFYKMNAIILAIIAIFLAIFLPYQSTLQNRVPSILGIPFTLSAPMYSLILIGITQLVIREAHKRKVVKRESYLSRFGVMLLFFIVVFAIVMISPVRHSIMNYINLSARFTTPSKPLFMTVQEYIPTGIFYNYAANGFGTIGASLFGIPLVVLVVLGLAYALIMISIVVRNSRTAVLYLSVAIPLMVAGMLEVKYLPHFGVAYIMLFCIIMGEALYFVQSERKLSELKKTRSINPATYTTHRFAALSILLIGLYFLFGVIAPIAMIALVIYGYTKRGKFIDSDTKLAALSLALIIIALFWTTFILGEMSSVYSSIRAAYVYAQSPSTACSTFTTTGNGMGQTLYCNTISQYWLSAMSWIRGNVGPYGPRVLAWWDYGDWINWFGNSNAVLRGDNAVAQEDYAVAAQYVLGPNYNATPETLSKYMNANQTKYVLFDQDLIPKWGALNFLACINDNLTSESYAKAQGALQNPPAPYALGTSQCELQHDPQFALVPLSVLSPSNSSQPSISDYCSISTNTTTYAKTFVVVGQQVSNQTLCLNLVNSKTGALQLYNSTGGKMNAYIQANNYLGVQEIQTATGTAPYVEYMVIYTPNSANGVITDAPSQFYTSTYYKGFFTGQMPGFTQVYPNYTSGTNFVNFTDPIRIYAINNYTGGAPGVPPKPSWIVNNDIMP